jgi:pyridoxal phosphate enzyme (YggS family)
MDFIAQIPSSVTIVAVSKNQSVQKILNLPQRITDIAENKIQEAEQKLPEVLSKRKYKTHFIGHLQSNKVSKALKLFDVIQSVDSEKLINKINQNTPDNKFTQIMLQINVSNDPKKYGFPPDIKLLTEIIKKIKQLKKLNLIGLMTILKQYDNPKLQLKEFQTMENLFNQINQSILIAEPLKYLSMGMSEDYQQALNANSNMLRLGTLIFNLKS